jgi:hypothetical protein
MENMSELERENPSQTDDDERGQRVGSDIESKEAGTENCGDEYGELPGDPEAPAATNDATLAGDSTKDGKP